MAALDDNFPRNLRRLRQASGITQAELATLSGYTRSSIANMERGGQDPTLKGLHALSDALEITVVELLGPSAGDDGEQGPDRVIAERRAATMQAAATRLSSLAIRLRAAAALADSIAKDLS